MTRPHGGEEGNSSVMIRRVSFITFLAAVMALLSTVTASADSDNVNRLNLSTINGCYVNHTECLDLHGFIQTVTTPSGNMSTTVHESGTLTFFDTNGNVVATYDVTRANGHTLLTQDGHSEASVEEVFTFDGTLICMHFHSTTGPGGAGTDLQVMDFTCP